MKLQYTLYTLLIIIGLTACKSTKEASKKNTTTTTVKAPQPTPPPVRDETGEVQVPDRGEGASTILTVNWTVVPGQNVGPIRKNTSYEELLKWYGEDNLSEPSMNPNDRGIMVHLLRGEPGHAEFHWADGSMKEITKVVLHGDQRARWKTPEGFCMGIDVQQLTALNGGPFMFQGFTEDMKKGGEVVSWEGGVMESYKGKIKVILRAYKKGEGAAYLKQLKYNNQYNSTSDLATGLRLVVNKAEIYFD